MELMNRIRERVSGVGRGIEHFSGVISQIECEKRYVILYDHDGTWQAERCLLVLFSWAGAVGVGLFWPVNCNRNSG